MLKPLRNKKVVQITMWGLVVIFVLWGAGSITLSGRAYAGVIFGKKISLQEYNGSYRAVLNRAKIMYGDNLPKLEKFLNLNSQAWDRLILKYEAKRKFIRTSNKEVIEKIAGFTFFQRNGLFDKKLYGYIVANIFRTTPRDFEESVRDDILIEKLMDSVTRNTNVTEDEIAQAYRDENELADVSFILIKPLGYNDKVTVEENELMPFYKKYENNFLSPIEVNVDYLKIPFSDKKGDARFTADELMSSIKKGKNLKAVAKEYNIELKNTGFFSINSKIPEIGLSYPFALAAVGLKLNEVSDIVETADSFYIMQLKSKKEPYALPFEEVKDRVKNLLIQEKASSLAESDAKNILSRINNEGKTLEDIANELSYKISTANQITKKSYVAELGPSEAFTGAAFSLTAGGVGGPAKTQKGYAIIRLDKLTSIDKEKFAGEKDLFSEKLLGKKKREYFENWFIDIRKKANPKDNISS